MPAINLQTSASGPKLNLRVGNKTYVLGEQKTETVTQTVYQDRYILDSPMSLTVPSDSFTLSGELYVTGDFAIMDYALSIQGFSFGTNASGEFWVGYYGHYTFIATGAGSHPARTWVPFSIKVVNKYAFTLTLNGKTYTGTNSRGNGVRVLPHAYCTSDTRNGSLRNMWVTVN